MDLRWLYPLVSYSESKHFEMEPELLVDDKLELSVLINIQGEPEYVDSLEHAEKS